MGTISDKELRKLERAKRKLDALEAGGVDNWEWYGESLKDFFKDEEQESLLDAAIAEMQGVIAEPNNYEVDIPSVREAGYSVFLTEEGEKDVERLLRRLMKEIERITKEQ